jgi:hypothetical protein
MKKFVFLLLAWFLLGLTLFNVDAQVKESKGDYLTAYSSIEVNGVDTVTRIINNTGAFDNYHILLGADELSGADTVTFFYEMYGVNQYRIDTATITADGLTYLTGSCFGEKHRLWFSSSDTDSTTFDVDVYLDKD